MPVRAMILGVGNRGEIYASYALSHPEKLQIIAIADTNPKRIERVASQHQLSTEICFEDWESALKIVTDLDAVIITLPDALHYSAAMKSLDLGYHVLLEKPMATTVEECLELVEKAEKSKGIIQICHVLRYTQFYKLVKMTIDQGKLGNLVSLEFSENVSYYHYAHSYIRGNWRSQEKTGPFILTKSSHDLDLLYWFSGAKPKFISSFGHQSYFGKKNKPKSATTRCLDPCSEADTCLYYAPRMYLEIFPIFHIARKHGSFLQRQVSKLILRYPRLRKLPVLKQLTAYQGWPLNVVTEYPTPENIELSLVEGDYGRCVYDFDDHTVMDHQVVNIKFENNITAVFSLHGHASEEWRNLRIIGTKANLEGKFSSGGTYLTMTESLTNAKTILLDTGLNDGHGGGDLGIVKDFVENVLKGKTSVATDASQSLISHLMAFAADKSRRELEIIKFDKFGYP